MKKGLKITLIAVGSVIGLGAIAFFTLGGLPFKKLAEKNCPILNYTASAYPYADLTAPADFETIEKEGISLKAPAGLHPKDDSDPEHMLSRAYVRDGDSATGIIVLEPYDFGALALAETDNRLTDDLIADFCKSVGQPPLTDWYSFYDLMYHLNLEDCSVHSFRQANMFYIFALAKEEVIVGAWESWDFQTDDGAGFIQLSRTPETTPENPRYTIQVQLFGNDDRNLSHDVLISAAELETCCQIANSIRLTG